jgi:hypothetical protein
VIASTSNVALERLLAKLRSGALTFDELLEQYCSFIFSRSANLTETARKLAKHRATIQGRIRPEMVEEFRRR